MREPNVMRGDIGQVVAVDFSTHYPAGVTTWQDAERLGLDLMHYLGFPDAVLTGAGTDGGIDVNARDGCCQVKHWAKPVGRQELQRLVGAATGRRAIFLASAYSPQGIAWSDAGHVALFTFDMSGVVQAANGVAVSCATGPNAVYSDREAALLVRTDRVSMWTGIIGEAVNRLAANGAATWPRRDLKRAMKAVSKALANIQRANAALERASQRRDQAAMERAVAEEEFELRKAAAALRIHLPE